ncbi:hypothetical protein Tco_0088845 [Tanacetum coccineum]
MIVESLKEEKMYVKFSNNVEAEQRGKYLMWKEFKWCYERSWQISGKDQTIRIYYDARSKDLEAGLEKGEGDCLFCAKVEDYLRGMDMLHLKHGMERNVGRLWVVEGLTLERCSTFGKKDKLEPSYVEPFEILGWIGPIVRTMIDSLADLGVITLCDIVLSGTKESDWVLDPIP